MSYCIADRQGNLIREQWFDAPYCAMMHDFAITERYALFPIYPTTCSLERLKAGGVYVNGARQNLPHTPFGGLGVSGYGKEGGRAGIDEFLRYKTVSIIEPE